MEADEWADWYLMDETESRPEVIDLPARVTPAPSAPFRVSTAPARCHMCEQPIDVWIGGYVPPRIKPLCINCNGNLALDNAEDRAELYVMQAEKTRKSYGLLGAAMGFTCACAASVIEGDFAVTLASGILAAGVTVVAWLTSGPPPTYTRRTAQRPLALVPPPPSDLAVHAPPESP